MIKMLFLGDVVGKPGMNAVKKYLPLLREKWKLDFVVVNAENAAGGFGITHDIVKDILGAGADVITLGDHAWDKKDADDILSTNWRVLRPVNFPGQNPGQGFKIYPLDNGKKIAVLNIMGRAFIPMNLDCPFQASRKLQGEYRLGTDYDALLVDVHAEATAEAVCLGHLWDGKASVVSGSHTHIPTADAHIMPRGTGYQTDAGMCGFYDSSLGSSFESALKRFESGRRSMLVIAEGEGTVCGTYAEVDDTGRCTKIEAVRLGGVLQPTHSI